MSIKSEREIKLERALAKLLDREKLPADTWAPCGCDGCVYCEAVLVAREAIAAHPDLP